MKTRIITGSIIGLVVIAFFALRQLVSPYFFDAMIGIIMICGAGEVSKVFNRSGKYNNIFLATIFPVAVFLAIILGAYFKLSFLYVALIELGLFLLFVLIAFVWTILDKKAEKEELKAGVQKSKYVMNKTLMTTVVLAYPTLLLSFLCYINHMSELGLTSTQNLSLGFFALVILFTTTMLTDVCAYFVGSTIKGKKLCPYISPNKTISGAIGGVLGAVVGAICCYYIFVNVGDFSTIFHNTNFTIWLCLIYSVVASILSQAGDIFASWLKRTARTKDFSTIFPGHGGFMDRCDGIAFNAVLTFIFFAIIF